ncbi:hypothetical protein EB093_01860 [bacterium]|nr:hypothetical protein [bacterium]
MRFGLNKVLAVSIEPIEFNSPSKIDVIEIGAGAHPNVLSVGIALSIAGYPIRTQLQFPIPRIYERFRELEEAGIEWSRTSGYFSGEAIHGLQTAFVGALVSIGYPPEIGHERMVAIDRWLRLAFYADKIFDKLSAHAPEKIYQLRKRIESVLTQQDRIREVDPPIVKGFHDVFFGNEFLRTTPSVLTSFLECLKENEQEAQARLGIDILNTISIEKIRIKSCGGYHCIVVGAAAFGIDAEEYFDRFTNLRKMSEQVGVCTGWSNDIVSADDEYHEVSTVRSVLSSSTGQFTSYHSLNLVHNYLDEHASELETTGLKMQEAVDFVADKFNQEVVEFYKFKNLLDREMVSKAAGAVERDQVGKLVDVSERWIETAALRISIENNSDPERGGQKLIDFIEKMTTAKRELSVYRLK